MLKIKTLVALAGISLLITLPVAALEPAPENPSDNKGRFWGRGGLYGRIMELQHQVTELERKMQSGVVVVCNCDFLYYAMPMAPKKTDDQAGDSDDIANLPPIIGFDPPMRVKGYGYSTTLAKWDAINTCWKINGGWYISKGSEQDNFSDELKHAIESTSIEEQKLQIEEFESKGMKCHHVRNWHY